MKNYFKFFLGFIKGKWYFFKKNDSKNSATDLPLRHSVTNEASIKEPLPDLTTIERTMFMLERVRSVFDFAPPISLIPEMRIINKGLSYLYHAPYKSISMDDKNNISKEVTQTVQKFSYILPEIEFLLTKIENLSVNHSNVEQAEDIKNKIIFALEKVSYEKNSLTSPDYSPVVDNQINYHISFNKNKE